MSIEAMKLLFSRETVLSAMDDLNNIDDFLSNRWIEHDLVTGRIHFVLCEVLKDINNCSNIVAKKLIKKALYTLQYIHTETSLEEDELINATIESLSQFLSEAFGRNIAEAEKQEPVGFYDAENKDLRREIPMGEDGDWWQPVYTHPQPKAEQKPLDNKCPDKERTEYVCSNRHQCWEPCGELGKSEEHTKIYEQEPKREPLTDEQAERILLDMADHVERFCKEDTTEKQMSGECIRYILERVAAHGIKENT